MSPRHIMDTLLSLIVLSCVCLVSSNSCTKKNRPSCPAHNPLVYAGHQKLPPGLVNNVSPTCGQKIVILRLPPRLSNQKTNFPFGPGKGRIWIRRTNCKSSEPPQEHCPLTSAGDQNFCSSDTQELPGTSLANNITLTFHNVSSTTIGVTWLKLDDVGLSLGPVSGFAVEYRKEGVSSFIREDKNESNTHIFSNLDPDTVYEFRLILTSCSLPGDVLRSEKSMARTLCGDIGPVMNLSVTDTGEYGQLYVSWEKPMKESDKCIVSHYVIDYILVRYRALSENDTSSIKKSVEVIGTGYQTLLEDLEDYAIYLVSVTPITTWNDKESTESQTGNTIENIPRQVMDFDVAYSNLSIIQVTWSLPLRPKGDILQYIISFEPVDVANETINRTVEATLLQEPPVYTLTDLQLRVNYSIRIQAMTAIGRGNWSELTAETKDYVQRKITTDTPITTTAPTTRTPTTRTPTTRTPTTRTPDDVTVSIIIICAAVAVVILALPLGCVCFVLCTKKKQKAKEKEKARTEANLVNGPSPYMALEEKVEDLTRYMKIGDFGPSTYMVYGRGNEENQLYTGINLSQRNSSSLDVTVPPSYDTSGYAGLTQRPTSKDYTQLFSKTGKDGSSTGDANDENGNKNVYNDPSGYMGLQNRPHGSDYTKLLSKPGNGDSSTGSTKDGLGNKGGLSTFKSQSPELEDKLTKSTKLDDGSDKNEEDVQGSDGKSMKGKKQTVSRDQYERKVIPDENLLQVPYFEHIGSDDGRFSYIEPIGDDEEGTDNQSTYTKPVTSYETSLQIPMNPLKGKDSTSETYEATTPSYETAIDDRGQPFKNSDMHRENSSQLITSSSSSNGDVQNRISIEYFEPIGSDDEENTKEKKEGSYARATREVYESIPDGLQRSQRKSSEDPKYKRTNYSTSINATESKKIKKPGRLQYEKSLPNSGIPLKSSPNSRIQSSGYEDAASGLRRQDHSVDRIADNSQYFPSRTGTMLSNASREYFEPIADDDEYTDDPEIIKNKLENYEMITELHRHLRTTEKNSSKICSTTDVSSPPNNNKKSKIPKIGENSRKLVYETTLTETAGGEKRNPSSKSSEAGRTNSAVNRERWLEALRKASPGYYQKSVGTADNNDQTAGYTSGNYIEPIASDEEADGLYETTQHEQVDGHYAENVVNNQNTNQKRLQAQQSLTVESQATDPEVLYQAIPAYGSFHESRATEPGVLGHIKIKNLPRQLWNGSSSPEITLSEEFQALPHGQQYPWTAAKAKDDDVASGILPYDHSRVNVKGLSGDSKSDYYNGNYIKDHLNKVNFIAAKVPKKATSETFWRMVWDSKTEIVVILASGKSYLPSEKEAKKNVGKFTLAWSTHLEDPPEFYIRQLELKKGNAVQLIKVCHHRVWLETCRVPHPSSVIDFVRKVKFVRRKESVPILVQCSNGIGATGVFIAVYCLLNYLKTGRGSPVSVHDFVQNMRKDRVDMVQSKDEYLLVYETLISAVLAPERAVTVDVLMRMNLIERQDALEQEFETLTKLDKLTVPRSTDAGARAINIGKNRYPAVLPLDSNRVVLKSLEKSGSDSYINATLINSTYSKNALIMAQSPLPSTIEDFWRMIYQYECSSVVSLNEMDSTNEISGGYLPKIGQKRYGKILVKCISNPENSSGLLQQKFSLSHSSSKKKIEVNHFQVLSWPREESQMAGFIRIMMKMQPLMKTQGTVTVHCLDGASRCGVFVAIATELGNLKNRGDIDLFSTVYELKGKSRHVITTYDDYLLCYRVLKGILDAREHDYETLPSV